MSVVADEHEGYNPDPVARIRLEELARVVALHVAEVTGDAVDADVEPVTRAAWARRRARVVAPAARAPRRVRVGRAPAP